MRNHLNKKFSSKMEGKTKTTNEKTVYKVVWKETALKQLAKIDKTMADKLTDKVEKYLVKDPINRGERLLYNYKEFYRYRFSDYRVIYEVKN